VSRYDRYGISKAKNSVLFLGSRVRGSEGKNIRGRKMEAKKRRKDRQIKLKVRNRYLPSAGMVFALIY
jgi:hypothetical protein